MSRESLREATEMELQPRSSLSSRRILVVTVAWEQSNQSQTSILTMECPS